MVRITFTYHRSGGERILNNEKKSDRCKTITMLQFCYNYYSQIILIWKEELNKDPASISHTLGFSKQRYSK